LKKFVKLVGGVVVGFSLVIKIAYVFIHPLQTKRRYAQMKKMETDINKPADFKPDGSFWHRPGSALWIYLILIMTSLYLWQGAGGSAKQYSLQ